MNTFLENQNWRYATKKFDAAKKIAPEDLHTLKEAIRLSTSSYGLQPYKVYIIEDDAIRRLLKSAAGGKDIITDASQLIVFANETNFGDSQIDDYIHNISETRGIPKESLTGYGHFIKSKLTTLPQDIRNTWTEKQTYIALGNLLNAAADLKIDVTPMEGYETELFNDILGLTEKGLNAAVIAAIGYRHIDDTTQHLKKVRKSHEELFINL